MNQFFIKKIIQFFLAAGFYIIIAKSLQDYGFIQALHLTFLIWSFFVLCLPVARGKILVGIPFFLLTRKKVTRPELITWPIALLGNIFTIKYTPIIYLKAFIPHLLYCILSNVYVASIVVGMCACATFYSAFSRTHFNRRSFLISELLIILSFVTTFVVGYKDFIFIINSHGNV